MADVDIEAVITAQSVLIEALDAGDVGRIEQATAALARVLDAAKRAKSPMTTDHSRVEHAVRQSEAARLRVSYLAERTQQKRDRLSEIRGGPRQPLYNPGGKLLGTGR